MIRFADAFTLAYTKLRTHRVRTGLVVGLSGILFGIILATVFLVQGVFDSVERFGKEGLNNRTILAISDMQTPSFSAYDHSDDASFIREVEARHSSTVARKTAAAKRYSIEYNPKLEDPSPIEVDPRTKHRSITDAGMSSTYVQEAAEARNRAEMKPFDIKAFLKPYSSARILPDNSSVLPKDGLVSYMKQGKEAWAAQDSRRPSSYQSSNDPTLMVLNGSIAKPFISTTSFDPAKGELPVILPYSQAEKLLNLKPLEKTASNEMKLERLYEVRQRIGEVTASYCYRNTASQQLLSQAIAQADEIKKSKDLAGYSAPLLQYEIPSDTSCGAVRIVKDTRTLAEKQQADRQVAYEKAVGTYLGEPEQHKLTLRGVGITSDADASGSLSSIGDMVKSLLGSSIGYGNWVIPADLLREVPAKYRPIAVFDLDSPRADSEPLDSWRYIGYMVEFDDKNEARAVLERTGTFRNDYTGGVSAFPFGSSTLIVDEMKSWFAKIMLWALVIIGGVAAVILGGIIGRTVSEGRRESAVFRAIGAKRGDIGVIYGMYALLLSARVVLFAVILGTIISLTIELLYWRDATLGARLAYAASTTTLEFHLFGVASWYLPVIVGVILVVGMLGSIIPIIRSARRNPINDMRDE